MKNNFSVTGLSPAQAEVLEILRSQPDPVGIEPIAEVLGKHTNTVREHLNALVRHGFVTRVKVSGPGRGRPSWQYVGRGPQPTDEELPEQAAALAWSAPDQPALTPDAAREAGREWGRQLVSERSRTDPNGTPEHARREVVGLLDQLGYQPEADAQARQVVLHRCPLLQAAKSHTDVVCQVHLGVVEATLDANGGNPEGIELEPFTAPRECRLRLL